MATAPSLRSRPRQGRGAPRRLVLGCAFALVVVYLVEVGLRLLGVGPAYEAGAFGGWRMTPDLDGRALRGPRDGHDFRVTTNADGLRTRLPKERTPGVTRIALMGDSTVFGWGVDDGGAISDGVEAALRAGGGLADGVATGTVGNGGVVSGGAFEVLNAGQPGYSTTQAAWLFEEVVAAYRPDRVVVFIPMHDFNKVLVSDREVLDGGATPAAKLRVALATHSRVYQLLRQAIWPMTEQPSLLPDQATGEPRVDRVSDGERAHNFDTMRARLAEWGGELLVGFLPFHADLIGARQDRVGVAWAKAYGEAHGVRIVDVRACCSGEHLVLPDDRGHLSAEGNRQVGAAIAAFVR